MKMREALHRGGVVLALCLSLVVPYQAVSQTRIETPLIASMPLTQFDLNKFCWGAGRTDKSEIAEGAFGLLSNQSGDKSFVYVTSTYNANVGQDGDITLCDHNYTKYELKNGNLQRTQIDDRTFSELKSTLGAYEDQNSKRFTSFLASEETDIEGCLFPIYWYPSQGGEYTVLSIAGDGFISGVVFPRDAFPLNPASTCDAWGDQQVALYSVISNIISSFSISDTKTFVELLEDETGLIFDPTRQLQCVRRNDALLAHVIVERKLFESLLKPKLLQTYAALTDKQQRNGVLPFEDSLKISAAFAQDVVTFAKSKGCL